jgi:hypothetical protein
MTQDEQNHGVIQPHLVLYGELFSRVTRIIDHVHYLLFSNFVSLAYHVAGSVYVCWGFGIDIAVVSPIICSGRFCVPSSDFVHD